MSDERLRALERRALTGDREAMAALLVAEQRAGKPNAPRAGRCQGGTHRWTILHLRGARMKQLPKAARDLRRAHRATGPFCDRCTGPPQRCCSIEFCAAVERGLDVAGLSVPEKPWSHGVPFLGPTGCTVPPEHRPGCSGFGCDQVPLEVRRTADAHLRSAYLACETTRVLADTAGLVSKALLNLKVEGCSPLVRDVHDRMREAGR